MRQVINVKTSCRNISGNKKSNDPVTEFLHNNVTLLL